MLVLGSARDVQQMQTRLQLLNFLQSTHSRFNFKADCDCSVVFLIDYLIFYSRTRTEKVKNLKIRMNTHVYNPGSKISYFDTVLIQI